MEFYATFGGVAVVLSQRPDLRQRLESWASDDEMRSKPKNIHNKEHRCVITTQDLNTKKHVERLSKYSESTNEVEVRADGNIGPQNRDYLEFKKVNNIGVPQSREHSAEGKKLLLCLV